MLLVDADPQGSPRDWHEQNGGEVLDVVGLDRETLARNLKVVGTYIGPCGRPDRRKALDAQPFCLFAKVVARLRRSTNTSG